MIKDAINYMDISPISIMRTRNAGLIESILCHPEIFPHTSDDFSKIEEVRPALEATTKMERIYYLLCLDENEPIGVFALFPVNGVTWDVHTNFLPDHRGPTALEAARLGFAWMFSQTECRKVSTWVPEYNKAAYVFAKRSGFQEEGVNRKSFLKNGVLYDQHLLGVCKEEACQ